MRSSSLLAVAASVSTAAAVYQGFNYGSTQTDGSYKAQSDFQSEFQTAKNLVGTSGFTSARLYTMIQGGTTNTPISAIPAAIAEGTSLLLGMWASGGQGDLNNEIQALTSAISTYGSSLTSLVVGLSIGSEDLYRISPTGIAAMSGVGADPATLTSYISQVRSALAGTALSGVSIGHVDTWTAWVNGSNNAVIEACDWIGMDAYPYFQNTMVNSIENSNSTFWAAYDATVSAVGGKSVWITETGWPVSGPTENLAVPSLANAQTYWDEVGCASFGKINTYWYTLQDAYPTTPSPSFGIVGTTLSTTPLYNLTCPAVSSASSNSASSSGTASSIGSGSAASSLAYAATSGGLASSGGGLTPSQGSGNGIGSSPGNATSTMTAPIVSGTGAVSGSGSGSNVTSAGSGAGTSIATGSRTGTSSVPISTYTGGAAVASGSMIGGVIGAMLAVVAAL